MNGRHKGTGSGINENAVRLEDFLAAVGKLNRHMVSIGELSGSG